MNRYLRLFFIFAVTTWVCARTFELRAIELPAPITLDGIWGFTLAPNPEAADALATFHATDFDASAAGFKTIPVPSNWVMHGFEEPHYVNGTTSEGFYLHSFTAPAEAEGKRALLRFDGVWQSAEVWLNGQLLGRHDSGFTAFGFEATRAIKPGVENKLAVRVRQQTPLFKYDANDDWALPGIYRSVRLEFTPKEWWLENVEVVTDFDEGLCHADLRLRVFVMRNEKADYNVPSPPFEVVAILSKLDGTEVQRGQITGTVTNGGNGRDCPLTMTVEKPAAWTAETPNLYNLRVELRRGENLMHAWSDRIGFREVSTTGGVLRVNGQPVKLRGVNRHDLAADVGRATRPEDWRRDLELMRAANINAVRTAHYPPAEGFVRLCDEMGFYVLEEVPFGFGGERMNDPSFAEGAFLRVHETVARDRNRPSVIIWDLGNEDPFTSLHLAALRALKGLDPTRPVLLPFHGEEDLPPEVDILAPHYWKAAEYDKLAAVAKRPIVTTEYTHALGPDDFGELQERWDALTKHPAGAGGMIWIWADQGIRRPVNGRTVLDPMLDKSKYTREGSELVIHKQAGPGAIYDAHGNLGTDGIVDADLAPQLDYWETKAVYAPVRVLTERVSFTPGQGSVRIPLRNDYDFTDLSTVKIAWKLFRGGFEVALGETKAAAAPHAEVSIEIPTSALADMPGGSAAWINLTFTDSAGRELTSRSVRLGDVAPEPARSMKVPLRVTREAPHVTVDAGVTRYVFDATSGLISSIRVGERTVAHGVDIVVWRSATFSERNQLDRRPSQHPWVSYLQGMTAKASAWNVSESASGVVIAASVEHRYDDKNAVDVDYTYSMLPAGGLRVAYVVKPRVELEWLPEIGVELKTARALSAVTWIGRGPGVSLPNRKSAALFGKWILGANGDPHAGTRSGVERATLSFGPGVVMQVRGIQGFRIEHSGTDNARARLLTHLAGAWTKNGLPERDEWRFEVKPGVTFEGAIELEPELVMVK